MIRFRTRKLLAAALAAAALIALPASAQADSRRGHRHHHRAHAVPVYEHGAHCASRHTHPAAYRHARPAAYRHVRQVHAYRCRPCERGFRSWYDFRRHAHHHHRVAPWRLPRLLVQSGPLWIFLG